MSPNLHRADRESACYRTHVRPLEYSTLLATAFSVLAGGCGVVLDAPFLAEVADPEWLRATTARVTDAGGALVAGRAHAGPETTRDRLVRRAAPRDRAKLVDRDAHVAELPAPPPGAIAWESGSSDPDEPAHALVQIIGRAAGGP